MHYLVLLALLEPTDFNLVKACEAVKVGIDSEFCSKVGKTARNGFEDQCLYFEMLACCWTHEVDVIECVTK